MIFICYPSGPEFSPAEWKALIIIWLPRLMKRRRWPPPARPLRTILFRTAHSQFNNPASFSLMLLLVYSARGARSVKKTLPTESERDFLFRLLAVNFCNTCQLMFASISTPNAFTGCLLSARESRDTPNKYTGTWNDNNSLAAQGSLSHCLFVIWRQTLAGWLDGWPAAANICLWRAPVDWKGGGGACRTTMGSTLQKAFRRCHFISLEKLCTLIH